MDIKTESPSQAEVDAAITKIDVPSWKIWTARLKGTMARQDPIQQITLTLLVSIFGLVTYMSGDLHKLGSDLYKFGQHLLSTDAKVAEQAIQIQKIQDKGVGVDVQLKAVEAKLNADDAQLKAADAKISELEKQRVSDQHTIMSLRTLLNQVASDGKVNKKHWQELDKRLKEVEGQLAVPDIQ